MHKIHDRIQNPIGNKLRVTLIGCGGTGSLVLSILSRFAYAMLHLKQLEIEVNVFDGDVIDPNNPCRQGFSPNEVGLFKNTTLISRINRFWNINWKALPDFAKKENLISNMGQIVITATDTRTSRKMVYEAIKTNNKKFTHLNERHVYYWIDLGNSKTTGNVILTDFKTMESPLDYYKNHDEIEISTPSCSVAQSLNSQNILINQHMATMGMSLFWDLINNETIDYKGIFINTDRLLFKKIKIPVNKT